MNFEPQAEHRWLHKLVGEWTYESECSMGPDQPPGKFRGSERVRSIGGAWVMCEGQGEMPGGGTGTMVMTLGYDPAKKRYVGTFIGSMMGNLWVYDGGRDGDMLTLDADGPSFTDLGKTAKYKDTIAFKGDDHRTLTSAFLGDDGKWHQFMTATYRRVK